MQEQSVYLLEGNWYSGKELIEEVVELARAGEPAAIQVVLKRQHSIQVALSDVPNGRANLAKWLAKHFGLEVKQAIF